MFNAVRRALAPLSFTLFATAAAASWSNSASAGTVDLSSWIAEGGSSNWQVQAGNDSVKQLVNGAPTYFFEDGSNAQGTSLSGSITVETSSDNDFIGFVLGYQSGEHNSATADYWLIDWKQANQGAAAVGLSLSHVTNSTVTNDFWAHEGGVNEVQRASSLGSSGWSDFTSYDFELVFTSSLIEVFVNGVKELSYSSASHGSSFGDGAFGFYNYSQSDVLYSAISEDVVAVPTPASLLLLLTGLAGFGLTRRLQRR